MAENEIGCPIHVNAERCMHQGCVAFRYGGKRPTKSSQPGREQVCPECHKPLKHTNEFGYELWYCVTHGTPRNQENGQ